MGDVFICSSSATPYISSDSFGDTNRVYFDTTIISILAERIWSTFV